MRLVFVVWCCGCLLVPVLFTVWQKDPTKKPHKKRRKKTTPGAKGKSKSGSDKQTKVARKTAAGGFDVLITVDKSIPDQQNLSALNLSVLILRARTNKYLDLKRLVSQALAALDQIRPGEVIVIRA